MTDLPRDFDRDGLLEYSVVFTDRSLNHMSQRFQQVMRDISSNLKQVYNAHCVAVVPGGGSFGMEAVARQFATDQHCLVIRNGFFSFRWSQIFDMGGIPSKETVLKAAPVSDQPRAPFAPAPIETVVATIKAEKPGLVFAPHVETASGIILPDDYLKQVAEAVHSVGGLFVLDCIASGAIWVDMKALGVDVLISAPQKGWSASPCSALVMMSEAAEQRLQVTTSTSFAADLKKWRDIMIAYEKGGHAYHATMPTDALRGFRDAMLETLGEGLTAVKERQWKLGMAVRELLAEQG
ncbi:MAG: aminotransferase class V-fold PLP-dependent enzyme, partial [Pseudomonadota bacterium]|nr:aminotransferase class V-fold PLP-dependent enzyme [Pseudomonadota bacterium]